MKEDSESLYLMIITPFAVHLRKTYIHLRQQLKLYGKYTFISTSMNIWTRIDYILVRMPSLPSVLARDFFLSKYWIHTRLQIYYDSLQHGAWTRWHSRLFFAGQQDGFVHLGVASPILHGTTYFQMFLLLCGHVFPVFLGRGCVNSWFICARVSRQC